MRLAKQPNMLLGGRLESENIFHSTLPFCREQHAFGSQLVSLNCYYSTTSFFSCNCTFLIWTFSLPTYLFKFWVDIEKPHDQRLVFNIEGCFFTPAANAKKYRWLETGKIKDTRKPRYHLECTFTSFVCSVFLGLFLC